jgi:DNA-binding transcriptional regulator YiaG
MDIRDLRLQLGLTQDKFAKLLHVAPYTIRRWESGKNKPSPLAQVRIDNIKAENNINPGDNNER